MKITQFFSERNERKQKRLEFKIIFFGKSNSKFEETKLIKFIFY